ncbi:MAG TPA: hypothetical protein VK640_17170 [Actinomycetes bacterium]|nr:hypothetical protein [Actinomycetes bacterium]
MTAPRLFGVPARDAPVVAVVRRGPSDWCRLGRWDVGDPRSWTSGSWLRATVYPQRCALSPDGRLLSYVALGGPARWSAGGTYVAVSRLPWATALAAWGTDGTWTRGAEFVDDRAVWELPEPDEGDAGLLRDRWGMKWVRPASYAVERRAGWAEAAGSTTYDPDDPWDIRRAPTLTMTRQRPEDTAVLTVTGAYAAFRAFDRETYGAPDYRLDGEPLTDVQWADWAPGGDLLVATTDGRLQVRTGDGPHHVTWEVDLSADDPDPQPPPPQAREW